MRLRSVCRTCGEPIELTGVLAGRWRHELAVLDADHDPLWRADVPTACCGQGDPYAPHRLRPPPGR